MGDELLQRLLITTRRLELFIALLAHEVGDAVHLVIWRFQRCLDFVDGVEVIELDLALVVDFWMSKLVKR